MRCVGELGKNVVWGERNEQDYRSRFLKAPAEYGTTHLSQDLKKKLMAYPGCVVR